jgi:hypothetical protein
MKLMEALTENMIMRTEKVAKKKDVKDKQISNNNTIRLDEC